MEYLNTLNSIISHNQTLYDENKVFLLQGSLPSFSLQKFTTFKAATTLGIIQNGTVLGISDRNNGCHYLVRTVRGEGQPFALENIQDDFGELSYYFSCFNDFLYAASVKGCCEYTLEDIVLIREEHHPTPLAFKEIVAHCKEESMKVDEIENIEHGVEKLFVSLGLSSAVSKCIALNTNGIFNLQTASYWVLNHLESLTDFDCTVEGLCSVGFCESAAKDFHMYFTSSPIFELQPISYWIVSHFKCMMMAPLKCSSPANVVS